MRRIIPPKTRVGTNIAKNFSLFDLLVSAIFLFFSALCASSQIPLKLIWSLLIIIIGAGSINAYGAYKGYQWLNVLRKHLISKKKYTAKDLERLTELDISDDNISLCGRFASVIEISPIEFILFKLAKQEQIIIQYAELIKSIKTGSIVKIEKPIDFSKYINRYEARLKTVQEERQRFIDAEKAKSLFAHKIFNLEALNLTQYDSSIDILSQAVNFLYYNNTDSKINAEVFNFVLYAGSREQLRNTENDLLAKLFALGLQPHKLNTVEINTFLNSFIGKEDISGDFKCPNIAQKASEMTVNGAAKKIFTIGRYPVFSEGNHWASAFFTVPSTVAVLNFSSGDTEKVKKSINKTINELQYRFYKERQATEQQSLRDQVDALRLLLQQFDYNNEGIHKVNFYIMTDAKTEEYKKVKDAIEPSGFKLNPLTCKQFDAWLSMFPGVYNDLIPEFARELQSTTFSAAFPFVNNLFLDNYGEYLGDFRYPIFFDMWQRDTKRVNSNACIIGQSGSGKTYLQKKLIMQQRVAGTKVFVLDCESEYGYMTEQLGGNTIEMTGGDNGVINPFQVFPSFAPIADELDAARRQAGDVTNQRIFLSEWFKSLLPMDIDTRTALDTKIKEMYERFKIDDSTNLEKLSAKDFPTFNDLHKLVGEAMKAKNIHEYDLNCLRRLNNYLALFSEGGNFARLWNGKTSLNIVSDFVVFDFQQLFANSNREVCNAQMLLLMRLLMREVINVQKSNENTGKKERVLVLVDEAHRYISAQFLIALDTLEQFARRIRKYSGSLIVATQNITDFIGSTEEMKAKASAIINNCQYNMLFSLKADDINKVQELYANYGDGLNSDEVQFLTTAKLGQMLFLAEAEKRQVVKVSLLPGEERYLIK
jgi:hypothetical protein